MFLQKLDILNFKNIEEAHAEFSPKLNCFTGNNGAGKTNMIDAVHYLSLTKSAFGQTDGRLVRFSSDFFMIDGYYLISNERTERVTASYTKSLGKSFKRNEKEYQRMIDHIGLLPSVLVSPSDTSLINDASEERRRYINSLLSQFNREYLGTLVRYNNVLAQRNKLLKEPSLNRELLEILDFQLAEHGQIIFQHRRSLVEQLAPIVSQYYRLISDDSEQVELSMRSELDKSPMIELLTAAREKDRAMGFTTVGIHRDDLRMTIKGHPIRHYGSQGQQKSFLIALKLAQFDIVVSQKSIKPILLLDDIFDKLDLKRVENLISLVSQDKFGQIFITDSNKVRLDSILDRVSQNHKLFTVEDGVITENR